MNPRHCFLILLFLAFLNSCDKKNDLIPEPEPYPDLSINKDRFLAEAKIRGYDLNLSSLEVRYVDEKISEEGTTFCGYGYETHAITGRRTVLISKANTCEWSTDSDLQREKFFFRELGHAVLNLPHDDSFLCDESPTSLMNRNVRLFPYYTKKTETRKYYIDELFDRLAALEQCLDFKQELKTNPFFFKQQGEEQLWVFSDAQGTMNALDPHYTLHIL